MTGLVSVDALEVRRPAGDGGAMGVVLFGVSFQVEAGEIVGIVGETGSGRSTLVRALNGIIPRLVRGEVAGTIDVAGGDPSRVGVAQMANVVAVVLDDPESQMTQPTVLDEVAFGPENLGVPVDEIRVRVAAALARVGLSGFENRDPLTLSGGEQQRLAVAAAIAMRPRLLVMDEPTASLDPRSARRILELADDVATHDGAAVVIVSSDVDLLAEHADRIVWLEDGRVRMSGSTAAVLGAIARETDGRLAPEVTVIAARLSAAGVEASALPATVDGAVAWVTARTRPRATRP